MKSLNFVTNEKGERIALQIPIPANITIEYLEDVEDVFVACDLPEDIED